MINSIEIDSLELVAVVRTTITSYESVDRVISLDKKQKLVLSMSLNEAGRYINVSLGSTKRVWKTFCKTPTVSDVASLCQVAA